MSIVIPNVQRRAIVDILKDTAGWMNGVKAALFKNDVEPNPQSVLADFTLADFDGYAASAAITWGTSYTDINNNAITVGDVKQFTCTGSTTPNTIYGYYIYQDATPDVLLWAERFDEPVPISQAGDAVVLVPRFAFGQ